MKKQISNELPKIRVEWRKDKGVNAEGKVALNFFIRYEGKTVKKATGFSIEPKHWNNDKKKIIGNAREVDRIRTMLDEKMNDFNAHCLKHDVTRGKITWKEIDLFFEDKRTELFFDFTDNFVTKSKASWQENTLKKHLLNLKIFQEFCKSRKLKAPTFLDLTPQFISDFRFFLLNVRGMKGASANNFDKTLKIILKAAKKERIIEESPYEYVVREKIERAPDIITLDAEEMKTIASLDVPEDRPHMKRVRDYFVFMMNTGLRYSDFSTIRATDFRERKSKDDPKKRICYLDLTQKKSDRKVVVPMNLAARKIFVKYSITSKKKGLEFVFNGLTNQALNRDLKELAKLAGIPKHLHCHLARHSFATNLRDMGVSLTDICDLLGHADMRQTKRYAKASEARLLDAVKLLESINPERTPPN